MDRAIIFILLLFFVACGENLENTEVSLPKESNEQLATEEEAPAEEEIPVEEEVVEEDPAKEKQEKTPEQLLEERENKLDSLRVVVMNEQESANALIEQAKNQKESAVALMQEAEDKTEKAKNLLTEEKKKKFEQRISFFIYLFTIIVIGFLGFFIRELYIWRNILLKSGNLEQLPEQTYSETKDRMVALGDNFAKLAGYINSLGKNVDNIANKSSDNDRDNRIRFEELIKSFNHISKTLQEKDGEIERLKKGYDNKIKTDIIKDILTIRDRVIYIEESLTNEEAKDVISSDLIELIDSRLEYLDVKELIFYRGEIFREIEGADVSEENLIETKNIEDKGKVIETVESGYYIDGLEGTKIIIRNAKIKCYEG